MAFEPLTDLLFNTKYAGIYRTTFGRIGHWVIGARAEDLANGDLPAFMAAVAWNSVHRFNKRFGWDLKPWEVAGYILDLLALLLKEIEHRIDIPKEFLNIHTLALGIGVDVGFVGLVNGTRIRANTLLEDWGRKMKVRNRELKAAGEKMTQKERRTIIGPDAYDSAEKFLDEIFDDSKTKDDGTSSTAAKGAVQMSINAKIAEMERSAEVPTRERGECLKKLLAAYQARKPEQSRLLIGASVKKDLAVEEFMSALEEPLDVDAHDAETDTDMPAQDLALLLLERRLASSVKKADSKKPEADEEPAPDDEELAAARQQELGEYLEKQNPYDAVPLPFSGKGPTVVIGVVVLLVLFVIAVLIRSSVGEDPSIPRVVPPQIERVPIRPRIRPTNINNTAPVPATTGTGS